MVKLEKNVNIRFVFIVESSKGDADFLYRNMQITQLNHPIYIDSLNAFRHANPSFPIESMFHTLLLDEENKVILVGNVGRDPEVRYVSANLPTTTLSLATSETYTDKQGVQQTRTEWHRVVLWNALAAVAEKYVRKGTQLYIEGRLATRNYTDKTGVQRSVTEVIAEEMKLLGARPSTSANE